MIENILQKLEHRFSVSSFQKAVFFTVGFLIGLIFFFISVMIGYFLLAWLGILVVEIPSPIIDASRVFAPFSTVLLTLALVLLYLQQTQIQSDQSKIMESQKDLQSLQHEPQIRSHQGEEREDGYYVKILNRGEGVAVSPFIRVQLPINSNNSGKFEIPLFNKDNRHMNIIPSGQDAWFRVDEEAVSKYISSFQTSIFEVDDREITVEFYLCTYMGTGELSQDALFMESKANSNQIKSKEYFLDHIIR